MLRFLVGYVSLVCFFVLGWTVEGGVPLQVVEPTALVIALGVPFFGVFSGVLGRILRTRVEENLSQDKAGPARKGRAQ